MNKSILAFTLAAGSLILGGVTTVSMTRHAIQPVLDGPHASAPLPDGPPDPECGPVACGPAI